MESTTLLVGAYLLLNLISLMVYYHDKRAAVRHRERTPERRLLAVAFVAPFGAYAGIRLFRHKTRKGKFLLVPAFMLFHIATLGYLVLA